MSILDVLLETLRRIVAVLGEQLYLVFPKDSTGELVLLAVVTFLALWLIVRVILTIQSTNGFADSFRILLGLTVAATAIMYDINRCSPFSHAELSAVIIGGLYYIVMPIVRRWHA